MSSLHPTSAEPDVTPTPNAESLSNTTNTDTDTEAMATIAMSRPGAPDLSLKTTSLNASHSPPRTHSPLSMDLSSVPGLASPAPPSNTLIITRLDDPKIFHAASLATIREHISSIAPLNSFSPLKSMHRIIVSFENEEDAIKVRQEIDRTAFTADNICKCYFGEPTPIGDTIKFLEQPDSGRLFFISPPPSPPVGWESKSEDPPNKHVHAEDLSSKLTNLTGRMVAEPMDTDDEGPVKASPVVASPARRAIGSIASISDMGSPTTRSRSATLIYDPQEHAESPGLPAVVLETEDDSEVELDDKTRSPMAHTMRPPVELMQL